MNKKLNTGDGFPTVRLPLTKGGELVLPDDIQTDYAMVAFYRGHW